jgi:hypothetical protein
VAGLVFSAAQSWGDRRGDHDATTSQNGVGENVGGGKRARKTPPRVKHGGAPGRMPIPCLLETSGRDDDNGPTAAIMRRTYALMVLPSARPFTSARP